MTFDDADTLYAHNEALRVLLRHLDLHVPGERAHAERVSVFSTATGHAMGLAGRDLYLLRAASELHDIGKLALDAGMLAKPGSLNELERDEVRLHPILASDILEPYAWLSGVEVLIRHHHERWDGGGYPDSRRAERIPMASRIIAVAEAFDAMVYRPAEGVSEEAALGELSRCAGAQFDPSVVQAFQAVQPLIQPL